MAKKPRIGTDHELEAAVTAIIGKLTPNERGGAIVHMATIGIVASAFAAFEYNLDLGIVTLGQLPKDSGHCLTSQLVGPRGRLDAYISIARLRGAISFMHELEEFAKETTGLAERRNRVVHDPWVLFTASGGGTHRIEKTARRKLVHDLVPADIQATIKLQIDITKHLEKFLKLHDRILGAVGT